MNKFSRAEHDQRVRDRKLTKLWNEGRPVAYIAPLLGYNHGSSVSHAAMRLGLKRRYYKPKAPPKKREDTGTLMRRVDRILAREKPIEAKWWRCEVCEGRCDSPTGHARCAA